MLAAEPWFPHAPDPAEDSGDLKDPAVLRAADLHRLWHRDFHYPRGVVPLGTRLVTDLTRGAQRAARSFRLAASGGLAARFVGPFVYMGAVPADPVSDGERAALLAELRGYPSRFRAHWAAARAELESRLSALERVQVGELDRAGLREYLSSAWQVHARAWEVHFEFMYPLLAVHQLIGGELARFGVSTGHLLTLLQAEKSGVLVVDEALSGLAEAARRAGLARLFTDEAGPLLPRLAAHEPAAPWLAGFRRFLARYGQRGDALGDLTRPSWAEDPEQPLALIRALLAGDTDGPRAGLGGRTPDAESGSPGDLPPECAALLEDARRANVVWWNEEHNLVIDLRVHLPIRAAAMALAAVTSAPEPDLVLYLFPEEVDRLAAGQAGWPELADLAVARRAYYETWRDRQEELPSSLGPAEAAAADPVLREIISASGCGSDPARAQTPLVLHGLGVSKGVARGRVRVLRSPDDLGSIRRGEVLVCQATSPSWTPVFPLLAACVCDVGGMLTHAATISREYGIPSVCDVGTATRAIRDGDEVEVDGTAGTVTLLHRPGSAM